MKTTSAALISIAHFNEYSHVIQILSLVALKLLQSWKGMNMFQFFVQLSVLH